MLRQQNVLIDRYIFNLPEQQLILMIGEKIGKIDDVSYNYFFISHIHIYRYWIGKLQKIVN